MSERLQERYGTGHPRRRIGIIVASTILGVTFISWLTWAAWFHSDPAIDAALTSYDVVNDHQVNVKIDARIRDADTEGTCLVRATAVDHSIVGELNLSAEELRSSEGKWIPIRTEREANTAELVRCDER